MTRATRNRVEQRLKRKGEKTPYDSGFARGWAQGRIALFNELLSPTGCVAPDGRVARATITAAPAEPDIPVEGDGP